MGSELQSPDNSGILADYIAQNIKSGKLNSDAAQAEAIAALDHLLAALARPNLANKSSALGWLFNSKPAPNRNGPRGIYLWGGVGRGKSMLMDLFFANASTKSKRRVHFHAFMLDVHDRIHKSRQKLKTANERGADPIPPLADDLAAEFRLLCFDEFAVTDAADAMILARLFTNLFERGVTVVATSNVAPDLLYKDGLNRSFFLPFIELVNTRMSVIELHGDKDHRMEKFLSSDVYFVSNKPGFEILWSEMIGDKDVSPAALELKGREVDVEKAAGGVARVHFDDLCRKPLGAGDYLALAEQFHTIFLEGIPVMEIADRNAAKRFIVLIDTLYDEKRILIAEAETEPDGLYPVTFGTEAFEFKRTVSRLMEMRDSQWIGAEA